MSSMLSGAVPAALAQATRSGTPEFILFLNDNEGFVQAVSIVFYILTTLVFILATFRANRLARESVGEMQKMHDEEMRPRVIFDLQADPGQPIYVLIRNIGRTTARSIRVGLTSDVEFGDINKQREDGRILKLMDLPFIESTESLVPEREIRTMLMFRADLFFRHNKGRKLHGTISYADTKGKVYTEDVRIDLEDFMMVGDQIRKDMHDLVTQIERFQQAWERNIR